MTSSADSYDRVPYGSRPIPEAHPDRLWVAARLFGLHPPDPATARILDLGCGAGMHLTAIAARLPRARCVGVDRAPGAVAEARRTAERTGTANVAFLEGDLADPALLTRDGLPEAYDYVVAHGVYSWVDEPTRDALLGQCARWLAPGGIAYVSYNARPGWHVRGMLAEMLRFHASGFDAPEKRIAQARALLRFLADAVPESDPYGAWLRREARLVDAQPDAWVFHDLLAEPNDAVLVSRFVAHAHQHGLAYLGDADVGSMLPDRLPAPAREALDTLGADALRAEQYLDFVLCRNFRRSLLCRPEAPIDRSLSWDRLLDLTVRASVRPAGVDPSGAEVFHTRAGDALTTRVPLLAAALRVLGARDPGSVPFQELVAAAGAEAGSGDPAADRALIGRNLLACFARGVVAFGARAVEVAPRPTGRPRADPVVRALADGPGVPSLAHDWVPLEPMDRRLLPLLDGTRGVDDLVAGLAADLGEASLGSDADRERLRAFLHAAVPARLEAYAAAALLVG